jgi:hypothetical protein
VHGDAPEEVTPKAYTNFLCSSPLIPEPFGAPVGVDILRAAASAPVSSASRSGASSDGPRGWESPAGQAVLRCTRSVSSAWIHGESGGAGLPLTIQTSDAAFVYHGFRDGSDYEFPDLPRRVQPPVSGAESSASSASGAASAGASAAAVATSTLALPVYGYGSFHHRYFLDGRLVAVGVVDILPHCLSSVYLFYDPVLGKKLQLGKLTALREIQWVQAMRAVSPRMKFYYMGYYVHSCPKMRYKGEFSPSDLRCPVTGEWVPLSNCIAALDVDAHAVLARLDPAEVERRRRFEASALASLIPAVPFVLDGSGTAPLVLRQLQPRGQSVLTGILRDLLSRLGVSDGSGGSDCSLAARIVAFVR